MVKTISTSEARANLGDVLGSVYHTRQPVIIARKGKPVAVVISPIDFERLVRLGADPAGISTQSADEPDADPSLDQSELALLAEIEAIRREHVGAAETSESAAAHLTLREIASRLSGLAWPDDGFADDLEAIRAAQPPMGEPPTWSS